MWRTWARRGPPVILSVSIRPSSVVHTRSAVADVVASADVTAAGCAVLTALGFLAAIPARRRPSPLKYPLVDDDVSPPNRAQP